MLGTLGALEGFLLGGVARCVTEILLYPYTRAKMVIVGKEGQSVPRGLLGALYANLLLPSIKVCHDKNEGKHYLSIIYSLSMTDLHFASRRRSWLHIPRARTAIVSRRSVECHHVGMQGTIVLHISEGANVQLPQIKIQPLGLVATCTSAQHLNINTKWLPPIMASVLIKFLTCFPSL